MKKLNLRLSVKEAFIAGYNIKAGLNFIKESDILFELEGYKVIKNNNIVHSISSVIACTGFLNILGEKVDCVFVDDNYNKIPDYARNFFLYHEIGHIKNNHCNTIKKANKYALSRIFKLKEEEIEADKYAMSVVGKEDSIKTFDFLINNTTLGFITKRELKLRKQELLKL